MDGGGGNSPVQQQTQITELPEWAKPYAKTTLEKTAALTEKPYQTYDAPRIAGFSPLQQQAQQQAAGMQTSGLTGLGGQVAGAAALGGLGQQYEAGRFSGGQFSPYAAGAYMSPFIQQALQPQLREAQRASDILGQQNAARAVGQGAFGGSRSGLVEAERQRNLGMQQGDIVSKGLQTAYEQAQNQFNADQSRRMQAQQLGEQSRQFGANLGLQGLQTALQGAGQLGALGGQQFQQGMDINKLQSAYGGQQQALQQQGLDQAYQDFTNQQNYPYKQLGFMADMIRGLPVGQQSTRSMYEAPGSIAGQLGGIGMGVYGLSKLSNFMAEGGEVHGYADGGSVDSVSNIQSIVKGLSDQQLQQAAQAAQVRGDLDQLEVIKSEMAMRASERSGMAGAFNALPAESQEAMTQMAGGGVVAFADEGLVKGKPLPERASSPLGDFWRSIGGEDAVNALREYTSRTGERDRQINAAEDLYPGVIESMTPTERKRRIEAADRLMKGDQPVKQLSQAELAEKQRQFREEGTPKDTPYAATSTESFLTGGEEGQPSGKKGSGSISDHPVVRQAAQIAKAAGVPEDTFEDKVDKLMSKYQKMGDAERDEMKAIYERLAGRPEELRKRAGAEALMKYGFGFAKAAARPGARFFGSAAEASPIISQSMDESQKNILAAEDNLAKTRLDQLRFNQSMKRGDMQSALQHAAILQQDKKSQQMLELERQKLAMMASHYAQSNNTAIQKIADDLQRSNPDIGREQALQRASQIAGYSFRSDMANQGKLAEAIRKIDEKFNMLDMLPPESDMAKAMRANRDRQVAQAKQLYSGGADVAGGVADNGGMRIVGVR